MTYKKFLKKLKATPRKWKMFPEGQIRCLSNGFVKGCPLSVAIGAMYFAPVDSSVSLGMSRRVAMNIVKAADNNKPPTNIRKDLIKACGLEDK